MRTTANESRQIIREPSFLLNTWLSGRVWLVPLLLVLVGLVARFYLLDNQSLWGDEGITWYRIKDSLGACLDQLRDPGNQGPLHCVLLWFWSQLFGTSELALRSLSAVVGALGAVPIWLIATKLANRRVAVIAAALATLSPLWVYYSQDARPYALSLTLITGAVACALRIVEGQRIHWAWLVGYVLCACGAVLTHYFSFFVLFSVAFMLWKNRRALFVWLAASAAAAILPIVWVIWEWSSFFEAFSGSGPKGMDWGTYLWGLVEAFAKGLPSPSGLPAWLVVIGLGLVLLGAMKRQSIPIVAWLVLVVVGIQIAGFPPDRPGPWVRYAIAALPAFILLEAIGIERLWKRFSLAGIVALVAVIAISAVSLAHVYHDPALARSDFRTPVTQLKMSVRPEDRVILNRGNPAFSYYYGNTTPLPISIEGTATTPVEDLEEQVANAAAGARVVYLIKYMPPDFDPGDTIENWLNAHGTKISDHWVEHIRILAYDFRPTPTIDDAGVRKTAVSFGSTIQLAGWTIDPDIKANDLARVTLFWKANRKVPVDYKVFVHLVDINDTDHTVAQHDSVPAMGAKPPTTWSLEETVSDAHPLVIPAGDWWLDVGLYDPLDGSRLGVQEPGKPGDSHVLLGPIHVP